ncbi:Hypothetical predicted protein [Paramuricea clavata]|uniref:Reverse transcriptase domain-containing protein n=1 Tax=Paramuricea clavata TaxID=317549 RepID=A0A7D9J593_PARCT|nr:Hypothetical predicted protein [Paramuricea clavata]
MKSILLYTFYRPPNSSLDSIQQLNSSLDDNPESACVLLTGDFNLAIDWSLDHPSPTSAGGHLEDKFCELVGDYYLEQLISGSTHRDGNKLDLLLCNYPELIRNVITTSPEQYGYPTDHYILEFAIQQNFSRSQPIKRTIFDYERGNFEQLRNALNNTTFEDMPSENIDHHWNCWKEWFLTHVKNSIPMKVVTDTNSPPWIDGEVRHLLRKKYAALKRFRQSRTNAGKQKLRTLSQSVKYLVRQKHRDHLEKVKDSFAENPKLFWRYHKSVRRHRVSNRPEIVFNGETSKTAAHKAELFNTYFSSVFTSPRSSTNLEAVTRSPPLRTELQLSDIVISVDEVTDCLKSLDTSKASGPDGWFADYLNNRRQRVVVDCVASRWAPVISGVPQGSILGPVLFVIFINDIPEVTDGTSPALFADDTKVYKDVRSVTDCEKLQQTLDIWTQDNNIIFNASKCKVLSVTRKKDPITYPYHLGRNYLWRVENEKDLGVTLSYKLHWETHVNEIV